MKVKKFSEWLKLREMCGTFAVGAMGNGADFQVWGTPGVSKPHKKKKKKHKK